MNKIWLKCECQLPVQKNHWFEIWLPVTCAKKIWVHNPAIVLTERDAFHNTGKRCNIHVLFWLKEMHFITLTKGATSSNGKGLNKLTVYHIQKIIFAKFSTDFLGTAPCHLVLVSCCSLSWLGVLCKSLISILGACPCSIPLPTCSCLSILDVNWVWCLQAMT